MPALRSSSFISRNSPHSVTLTFFLTTPDFEPSASICRSVSRPFISLPKTTCLPSSQSVCDKNFNHFSKLSKLYLFGTNKELRAICIWARIRHTQIARTLVLQHKVLVVKLAAID